MNCLTGLPDFTADARDYIYFSPHACMMGSATTIKSSHFEFIFETVIFMFNVNFRVMLESENKNCGIVVCDDRFTLRTTTTTAKKLIFGINQ